MTYYRVLGLSSNASEACIKRAFRSRAKLLHPDVNPGAKAERDFLLLNEAYRVLINPEKRRLYDFRVARQRLAANGYYKANQPKVSHSTHDSHTHDSDHDDLWTKQTQSRFEKIFDHFLFLSMLFFGLSALFFGIVSAIEKPVDGANPYPGIIFGVLFTGLFLFGWDKMQRIKN